MLLDRSKIPSSVITHEQLIAWAGLCLRFNLSGNSVTLTFQRSVDDTTATRLCDAGIFKDAAGDDRIGVLVYPKIDPIWQGSAAKPWTYVQPLSTSAQAAMFDV